MIDSDGENTWVYRNTSLQSVVDRLMGATLAAAICSTCLSVVAASPDLMKWPLHMVAALFAYIAWNEAYGMWKDTLIRIEVFGTGVKVVKRGCRPVFVRNAELMRLEMVQPRYPDLRCYYRFAKGEESFRVEKQGIGFDRLQAEIEWRIARGGDSAVTVDCAVRQNSVAS